MYQGIYHTCTYSTPFELVSKALPFMLQLLVVVQPLRLSLHVFQFNVVADLLD